MEVEKLAAIFTAFSSNATIGEGLNLVRSLGGGKYEIVNLSTVPRDVISSKEASAMIQSVPARQDAFLKAMEEAESSLLKFIMAMRSTSKSIVKRNVCRSSG